MATISDWDERYRGESDVEREPEPLLVATAGDLTAGHALDLACGTGRHSLYLARLGWHVTAVDGSHVAIAALRRRAQRLEFEIDARTADLEAGEFVIEREAYDLICDFFYLERRLFPKIRAGVKPGGLFVGMLHRFDGTPGRYLLESGELREAFAGWKIIYYSEQAPEGGHRRATAAIVARKA